MKRIVLSLAVSIFCGLIGNSQTSEVLFINNNTGDAAASLDIEIRVMPVDTVHTLLSNVDYLSATSIIEIPANSILTFNFYEAGTSNLFYTKNNVVYGVNEFRTIMVYGSASSKAYGASTAHHESSSPTTIKYDFRHSSQTLEEIDLIVRETSSIIADNFTYMNTTFTFDDEITAEDYILDMTPFDDNENGLFAFELPGIDVSGEYIYLFTSGNSIYMTQMDGTVTPLVLTDPIIDLTSSINENESLITINAFPNPTTGILNFESSSKINNVRVINLAGELMSFDSISLNSISINELSVGVYFLMIETNNGSIVKKVVKQ